MKNTTTLLFLAFAIGLSLAPDAHAQSLLYGIKAGAGVAKFDYDSGLGKDTVNFLDAGVWRTRNGVFRPTFLIAGVLERDISERLFVSSGLQACMRYSYSEALFSYNRFRAFYLQVPLNLHYRVKRFSFGAGLYGGVGIGGTKKGWVLNSMGGGLIGVLTRDPAKDKLQFGSDPKTSNLSRLDWGLRGEVGYRVKRARLSLAWEQGISDDLKGIREPAYKSSLRQQALTASFTYFWLAK